MVREYKIYVVMLMLLVCCVSFHCCKFKIFSFFSSPVQMYRRAIALPPASALEVAWTKCQFYVKVFYMLGELSCLRTGLVILKKYYIIYI